MKREFYESYCIRVLAKVHGYECFVTYVYADSMHVHVYENGKAWVNFYMGGVLVMSCEEQLLRMTDKTFTSDAWTGNSHFSYDYVCDLEYACN